MSVYSSKKLLEVCVLLGAFFLFQGVGCVSLSTLHTARPVAEGKREVTVTGGLIGLASEGIDEGSKSEEDTLSEYPVMGIVDAQIRYGFGKNVDFGFRINSTAFIQGDVNWAFIDTGSFVLSANPTIGAGFTGLGGGIHFTSIAALPILADLIHTRKFTFTLGVKPGFLYTTKDDTRLSSREVHRNTYGFVGTSLGSRVQINNSFDFIGEIDFAFPFPTEQSAIAYSVNVGVAY